MNHSKLFVNIGDDISIEIEVCSNPRAHRIFWIAPNYRSIKISGRDKDVKVDNLVAKKVAESNVRVTCVQAELKINKFSWQDEGEYSLIAKNRYGFDGDSVVIKITGGIGRRRQRSKDKDRTISHKRNSEKRKLPQINASVNMQNYCYFTPIFMSIFVSLNYLITVSNSCISS